MRCPNADNDDDDDDVDYGNGDGDGHGNGRNRNLLITGSAEAVLERALPKRPRPARWGARSAAL